MSKKKMLITGGLGYLGRRLAQFFNNADQGYKVSITTRKEISKLVNIPENCQIINWDMKTAINIEDFEFIIHLAGPNEIYAGNNPIEALEESSRGMLTLLNSLNKGRLKQFLFISTIHVYGSPLEGNITEKTETRPTHPYAIINKLNEDLCLTPFFSGDLSVSVLRLSNAVGAPMDVDIDRWTLVVNNLCKSAVENRILKLHSDGTQLRDFICITDVCRAIQLLINKSGHRKEIFNLGSGHSISIGTIARMIQERCNVVLGYIPEVIYGKKSGSASLIPLAYNIEKLTSAGFEPMNNLIYEIDNTLMFCHKHFNV